jgi:hypothetical protein
MSELFSGVREVGYYGESQSFSISANTNNLSLGITLIQVPGTGIDPGGGTDTTAPTVSFSPANGASGVAISDNIIITFSEAVRNIDNTVLTDSNIDSLITLKLTNANGNNITFDATINGDKTVITINPTSNLPNSQAVYVAIGATVEDSADHVITAANATFTTASESSSDSVSFLETFTGGQEASQTLKTKWSNFISGLSTDDGWDNVTFRGSLDQTGKTCDDPAIVSSLINYLNGSGSSFTNQTCNGNKWSTGSCGNAKEITVGAETGICQCNSNYTIRVGMSNKNWGGIGGSTCGAPSQSLEIIFESGGS